MLLIYRRARMKIVLAALLALLLLGAALLLCKTQKSSAVFRSCRLPETTVIIDAGHGGEDGGAVSADGQKESEINLDIAKCLDQLMHFYGVDSQMTRRLDISIHDASAKTLREKKRSDIHNRVAMVQKQENCLLISIHQNAYPNPKYHGMQLFFANESAQPLAVRMQENARLFLDKENKRQALRISPNVYLMSHVTCRAILAECGFLSNSTDAQLLRERAHQKKVSITLAAACLRDEAM